MSHLLKNPTVQWAFWYAPEIIGGVLVASAAAVFFGGQSALIGLVALLLIGLQECERLANNARIRRATARRRVEADAKVLGERS